jgi:hypothetical protein
MLFFNLVFVLGFSQQVSYVSHDKSTLVPLTKLVSNFENPKAVSRLATVIKHDKILYNKTQQLDLSSATSMSGVEIINGKSTNHNSLITVSLITHKKSNKPLTSTTRFKKLKSTNVSDVEISAVSLITNKKDKNNNTLKPEGGYLDDLTLFNDPLFLDDTMFSEEDPENNTLFDNTLEKEDDLADGVFF